jgi:hypothetical protein
LSGYTYAGIQKKMLWWLIGPKSVDFEIFAHSSTTLNHIEPLISNLEHQAVTTPMFGKLNKRVSLFVYYKVDLKDLSQSLRIADILGICGTPAEKLAKPCFSALSSW